MITAGVHGIPFGFILCGVIWALALGFAAGNYACSLVHRLPRGRLMLDKKPYCGSCGTLLQVKDLFPVVSAMLLRHRCRYCSAPFPVSHTWTELLVGLLFVLAYLAHGYGDQFVLIVFLGTFLITLAAIEANEGIVMLKVLVPAIICGLIYRTLLDATIFDAVLGGLIMLMAGAAVWHKQIQPVNHVYRLPVPVQLLAAGGVCVGVKGLPMFLLLFAAFYLVARILRIKPLTIPFGFAVILPVLYPLLEKSVTL